VFDIIDRKWLSTQVESDTTADGIARFALERSLDMAAWLDIYRPTVRTS
jgi:asparagine synthase (glutamine-hydrolysing)